MFLRFRTGSLLIHPKTIGLTALILASLALCHVDKAHAQATSLVVESCGTLPLDYSPGATRQPTVDINGNTCTSGSSSVSVGSFAPAGNFAHLTSTATSADTTLPAGTTVALFNTGTSAVSCTLTVGAGTAAADENVIQPGSWFAVSPGSFTHFSCINQAGDSASNVVVASGGTGLPAGAGGGSSGGGSGGAVTIADGADVTQGAKADAPCTLPATTTACSVDALAKAIANGVASPIPAGTNTIGNVYLVSQYPVGAVPITASAVGTTAATTATLAGTSGKTTYLCSYSIRANATAAATVANMVTGVITGTMTHVFWVAPAASGLGVDEQVFTPCVPASAADTAIAVVSGAPGSGGNVTATATGYQL